METISRIDFIKKEVGNDKLNIITDYRLSFLYQLLLIKKKSIFLYILILLLIIIIVPIGIIAFPITIQLIFVFMITILTTQLFFCTIKSMVFNDEV